MANYKDNNADLGTQTIEGTSPPDAVEAEIVMPDGSSRPVPTADDLDAQLAALMAEPASKDAQDEQPIFAMPASDSSEDLDAQLAALMSDDDEPNFSQEEIDAVNAKIDAILDGTAAKQDPEPTENSAEPIILGDPAPVAEENSAEPIILGDASVPPVTEAEPQEHHSDENIATPEQNVSTPEQSNEKPESDKASAEAEEARAMLEQAMRLMAQAQEAQLQAQEAQLQAQAQMQQAQQQAQQRQQSTQTQPQQPDSASQSIIQQAQMMLQQAQQAQLQAQQAAQQAQMQAQAVQATAQHGVPTPVITDPYAAREVDRLKNELDGMRDLVNKLTLTISQIPGGTQQMAQMAQMPMFYAQQQQQSRRDGEDREQYRKLETELERMRREIMEKDLRDREKELDRRQKEAENTVKDIRPEMVQMSDSRDLAPMGGMNNSNAPMGNEYIPLANGVYYSIKDKQVYVMTPASNAAAASPTIEPKRTAPARPAPKRRVVARHRPSGLHRRPAPRRPGRPRR